MIERKYVRIKTENYENLKAFMQIHKTQPEKSIELYDISEGGVCIVIDKENFIQRDKPYSFSFIQTDKDGNQKKINIEGIKTWYLFKESQGKEMQYIGFSFLEEINLKDFL